MTAGTGWTHHEAIVNGIRIHWVEQGAGPLVVLLHGFPEFWYSWRHQIPVLARRFHVVAPDLRGYNLSEKPPSGYDLDTLTEDVAALVRHHGADRAAIAGHDWGGGVAWAFAARFPETTERLVVLNAPHPGRFLEALRTPRQLLRSSYMLFFQIPVLPEALLGARRAALLVRAMRRSASVPDAFSDEDIERYREALSRPGALTAALGYYRAALRHRPDPEMHISAPTLLLWGTKDQVLPVELTEGLERWVPDLRVELLDSGHWVQQERPEEVNRYMLEFLAGGPEARP